MPSLARLVRSLVTALACLGAPMASAEQKLLRIDTQYIAALGDPQATAGDDAQTWGLWPVDPGPRGLRIASYAELTRRGGLAPAGWRFDAAAWWLEEHGLIMEAPRFPVPPGRYVVTGGRAVTAILTVDPPNAQGRQAWSLADGATIHDVTHLGCRAALYTPRAAGASCTPDRTPVQVVPMEPGRAMPVVEGCSKQEYHVLIVIGMAVEG